MAEPVDILKLSYLNPLRFHKQTEKFACELIPLHERKVGYIQKFHSTDKLMLQALLYKLKWNSMGYKVLDLNGNEVLSKTGQIVGSYGTNYDCWSTKEDDNIIASLDPGIYIIQLNPDLNPGGGVPFLSEPFEVIEAGYENTESILIEYSHDGNEFDIAFYPAGENGVRKFFQLRVEGGVSSDNISMAAKDTFYVNQVHDVVMLSSKPYNVYKFTFGNGKGIPNWMADKINRILSLAYVELNGTQFLKNDGAKFEATRDKGYPFAGWHIELVPAKQRFSITEGVGNQLGDYNIDYNEDYL
jgi:hypothetical protein